MSVLENQKPERVFHYFEEICSIPHPSYHEEQISAYLVNFAKEHNLTYYQDDLYNVIMIKDAAPGYENAEPIIIQGHMDMVADQDSDCTKNMLEEGLDLEIIDGYVSAKGTTLGADDGIAVAMALALLEDEELKAPRIEAVITVSEEVGMEGAAGIDVSMLKGSKLINIDSEEEGIFTVGCAGGVRFSIDVEAERQQVSGKKIEIEITNCQGGHSGEEINKGRANASILVNRLLTLACSIGDINLVSYIGGTKDNAIPRSTSAVIIVPEDKCQEIADAMLDEAAAITDEFAVTEPDMEITITDGEPATLDAISAADTSRMISIINAMPNGIQKMSQDIKGLVETSLNLGILLLGENGLNVSYSVRSAKNSDKEALVRKMANVVEALGGKVSTHGHYVAWEYKKESKLRETMVDTYKAMYGEAPEVKTIHAGLECGILSSKISDLDAVSIGPQMYDIHTPKERLSIESTERVFEFVKKVIAQK